MIQISGKAGGGQLLRSSLTLALATGHPFLMTNIRGARPKPGLMRQHLTCVEAALAVSGSRAVGAEKGSQTLEFTPGPVRGGDYHFDIGSGGSTTLVLQTVLPALLGAAEPSTVTITGGTHNPMAPPVEFLQECYLPVLRRMGAAVEVFCDRPGFMQAGKGVLRAVIRPLKQWRQIQLLERGALVRTFGSVRHAHLPLAIAERQIAAACAVLGWASASIAVVPADDSAGPGSIILLGAEYENVTELSSSVAEMQRTAESLGKTAAGRLQHYLASTAAVGVHLADQLLLPMALSGGGAFSTLGLSKHSLSHMELIPHFLPGQFSIGEQPDGRRVVALTARPQ
jgi:RNA 3'-terminal phosphate cyclase (ATP)